MDNAKNPLASKTLWANAAMAGVTAVVQHLTQTLDPTTVGLVFAIVNGGLRLLTRRPIKIG